MSSHPEHNTNSPWKTGKMERGTAHGHTLLDSPELVPKLMRMVLEPPMSFQLSEWLLQNAALGEVIPIVMTVIKLTAWKVTSQYMLGIEL